MGRRGKQLRWGPQFLRHFIQILLAALAPLDQQVLSSYFDELDFDWGTGCSGSESCSQAFNAISAGLLQHGCSARFHHIFAAEIDPRKRQFILQTCRPLPAYLFGDIFDLSRSSGHCYVHNHEVPMATVHGIHRLMCLLAGFSCTTVSGVRADKEERRSCVDDSSGAIGLTFAACLLILSTVRPLLCILENVVGLKAYDQDLVCVRKLRWAGYFVHVFDMNSLEFKVPQSRRRLYFVCFRMDWPPFAAAGTQELERAVMEIMASFKAAFHEMPLMDIDDFLMPETCATCASWADGDIASQRYPD